MIRIALGFLIVFGCVGGLDNATDSELFTLTLCAIAGLVLMFVGINKVNNG